MASWSVTHLTQSTRSPLRTQEGPSASPTLAPVGDPAIDALLSPRKLPADLAALQGSPPSQIENVFGVRASTARGKLIAARFAVDGAIKAVAGALESGAGLQPQVARSLEHASRQLGEAAASRDVQVLQSSGNLREEHLELREAYAALVRHLAALQIELLRSLSETPISSSAPWRDARALMLGAVNLLDRGSALEPEQPRWSATQSARSSVPTISDVFPYPIVAQEYAQQSQEARAGALSAHLEAERLEAAGDARGAIHAFGEAVDRTLAIRDWSSGALNQAVAQMNLADAYCRLSPLLPDPAQALEDAKRAYSAAVALFMSSAGRDGPTPIGEEPRMRALAHAAGVLNAHGAYESVTRMIERAFESGQAPPAPRAEGPSVDRALARRTAARWRPQVAPSVREDRALTARDDVYPFPLSIGPYRRGEQELLGRALVAHLDAEALERDGLAREALAQYQAAAQLAQGARYAYGNYGTALAYLADAHVRLGSPITEVFEAYRDAVKVLAFELREVSELTQKPSLPALLANLSNLRAHAAQTMTALGRPDLAAQLSG